MAHSSTSEGRPRERGGEPEVGERSAIRPQAEDARRPREVGGPKGPEPTRYGDWERNGRCSDF